MELHVGEPYVLGRTEWPECAQYNFRADTHELVLFFNRPSDREIEEIRKGPARFALYLEGTVIILCYRFGSLPWSDASYCWHKVPAAERTAPWPRSGKERALLPVTLVDASTGLVRALRVTTFSPVFTATLHQAIRGQIERDTSDFDRTLDAIMARYSTQELVDRAVITSDSEEDDPGSTAVAAAMAAPQAPAQEVPSFAGASPYDRPGRWLRVVGSWYPDAWTRADEMRRERGRRLPRWPDWCFLPIAGAYTIVSRGESLPLSLGTHPALVAALAAWRATQGIYQYDDTLLEELRFTPVEGEIPVEVLHHLPEWCVYVMLPTPTADHPPNRVRGFFAHLEADLNSGRTELRLLLDADVGEVSNLFPIPLHLLPAATLSASLQAADETARMHAAEKGIDIDGFGLTAEKVAPYVSLLLYLCSEAAEIRHRRKHTPHPRRPPIPCGGATTWEIGYRLGPALRAALTEADSNGIDHGAHARPRPHVRRAHWHSFWTGPQDSLDRKLVVHWLPPIPVNLDLGTSIPTVRKID